MSQDPIPSTPNSQPPTDQQPHLGPSPGQVNNLYTVTVVEGELPQVKEHPSLADLASFLRELVNNPDKAGTFCAVFNGARLFFSTGRIPYLLLDGNPIPLSDNDMSPNTSGVIGPTMSDEPAEDEEEQAEPEIQRPAVEQTRLPNRAHVEDLDDDEDDEDDEPFDGDIIDDWEDK